MSASGPHGFSFPAFRLLTWLVLAGHIAIGAAAARQTPMKVNPDAQLINEFLARVQEYVGVHRKADSALPEVSTSASSAEVDAHQRALQRSISDVRARAKPGDIFSQPIRAYFRRQLLRALSGPDAAQIVQSIREESPGAIRLRVNEHYPDTVPVSTMPARILAALPKLPPEVEYRFIGHRLVLLDVHAQLVVDYMDDALPR